MSKWAPMDIFKSGDHFQSDSEIGPAADQCSIDTNNLMPPFAICIQQDYRAEVEHPRGWTPSKHFDTCVIFEDIQKLKVSAFVVLSILSSNIVL